MTDVTPDETLDARGLNCPLPVLKAKKTLKTLDPGGVLEIKATDPGAPQDFEAFCRATGNTLMASEEAGGEFRFLIQKSG